MISFGRSKSLQLRSGTVSNQFPSMKPSMVSETSYRTSNARLWQGKVLHTLIILGGNQRHQQSCDSTLCCRGLRVNTKPYPDGFLTGKEGTSHKAHRGWNMPACIPAGINLARVDRVHSNASEWREAPSSPVLCTVTYLRFQPGERELDAPDGELLWIHNPGILAEGCQLRYLHSATVAPVSETAVLKEDLSGWKA